MQVVTKCGVIQNNNITVDKKLGHFERLYDFYKWSVVWSTMYAGIVVCGRLRDYAVVLFVVIA